MVKIPFIFYLDGAKDEPDWESLGIPKPEEDSETKIEDVYIRKDLIRIIEPEIDGDGSYIWIEGNEIAWKCPLSPEKVYSKVK